MQYLTTFIDDFLKGYSHRQFTRKTEQLSNSVLINTFIKSYRNYLSQLWKDELKEKGKSLLNADDSLIFCGDAFHLSGTFREEQVSSWLNWILRMDILDSSIRDEVFSFIISKILESDSHKKYSKSSFILSFGKTREFILEYPIKHRDDSEGRIDILIICDNNIIIAIENKIGDLNLEKNDSYLKSLQNEFPGQEIITILLIPENDLDSFINKEEDDKQNEKGETNKEYVVNAKTKRILTAFPPVCWEDILFVLYEALKEFSKDDDKWTHWKSLTLAFISFVEGNVLKYDIESIKNAFIDELSNPNHQTIEKVKKYLKYRRKL